MDEIFKDGLTVNEIAEAKQIFLVLLFNMFITIAMA